MAGSSGDKSIIVSVCGVFLRVNVCSLYLLFLSSNNTENRRLQQMMGVLTETYGLMGRGRGLSW